MGPGEGVLELPITGGTQKPDNPHKGIRNPIPQDPDNPLTVIWYIVETEPEASGLDG